MASAVGLDQQPSVLPISQSLSVQPNDNRNVLRHSPAGERERAGAGALRRLFGHNRPVLPCAPHRRAPSGVGGARAAGERVPVQTAGEGGQHTRGETGHPQRPRHGVLLDRRSLGNADSRGQGARAVVCVRLKGLGGRIHTLHRRVDARRRGSINIADPEGVQMPERAACTHVQRALHALILDDNVSAAGYLRRALRCLEEGSRRDAGRDCAIATW